MEYDSKIYKRCKNPFGVHLLHFLLKLDTFNLYPERRFELPPQVSLALRVPTDSGREGLSSLFDGLFVFDDHLIQFV